MFEDLQIIQNHALRAVLNIQDPLDLNIVEMHDSVHVKMLRHRMLIKLLMCIRNAFINQSLHIICRDVVTIQWYHLFYPNYSRNCYPSHKTYPACE